METIEQFRKNWRNRLRKRIFDSVPPGPDHDAEVERRVDAVLDTEVPTDDELIDMQRCGELPSDAEMIERHVSGVDD